MFLLRRTNVNTLVCMSVRRGHGPDHWSVLKKKKQAKDKALEHFDDFYQTVYTSMWPHIRSALLKQNSKYVAVVNNFSNAEETVEKLQLLGALNIKDLYAVRKKAKIDIDKQNGKLNIPEQKNVKPNQPIEDLLGSKTKAEIQSLFPESYEPPENILDDDTHKSGKIIAPMEPVQMRPMEEDIENAEIDEHRIIKTSAGLTSSSLYEYIPATKLKGLDDYILESEHYGYYTKSADFKVDVENESSLNFPEHLKIFAFDAGVDRLFPMPRRGSAKVLDYYCMDGGSILPVLALDLQPGDVMLDMCAAPGGKSLVALQTLFPKVLVANDVKLGRLNHMNQVMQDYLGDFELWEGRLFLTNSDARTIEDKNVYNKILVDVPCTTDRHTLHNEENNIFKPTRIKERLQLPEYQAKILLHALKIVAPGGTVVYSTCSLSPVQNDGVVQMAMKMCWEETESVMVIKDMTEALGPLSCIYKFGDDFGLKYGHIVIPTKRANWGPMYFCKIMRLK